MTNKTTMPDPVVEVDKHTTASELQYTYLAPAEGLEHGDQLITTDQAEAYADARVRELASGLQHLADRAYCGYIDTLKSTQCLGWENKVKSGKFGTAELNAHKEAAQLLGRHRAFSESVKAILALIK